MLSVPNVFLRPREQAKRADEAKSKFTHADGRPMQMLCILCTTISVDLEHQMQTAWALVGALMLL